MRKGLFIGMLLAFLSLRGYGQIESPDQYTIVAIVIEITPEVSPVAIVTKLGGEKTIAKSEIKKVFSWWDTSWECFFKDSKAELLVFKTDFIDLLEQSEIDSTKKEKLLSVWEYLIEAPMSFTIGPNCTIYAADGEELDSVELIKPDDRVEITYIICEGIKIAVNMVVVSASP